jgi:glycosyltransferase involved in cell wall biosynthesis
MSIISPWVWLITHFYPRKGVCYFENFPKDNAGYQYRAKKWVEILNHAGIRGKVFTIVSDKDKFDAMGFNAYLELSMFKRIGHILASATYQTVIVRRELLAGNDYGGLFWEKILLWVHPDVILDFDDDIASSKGHPIAVDTFFGKIMMQHGDKFNASLSLYPRFICGSKYLADMLKQNNSNILDTHILELPTCVDYYQTLPKEYGETPLSYVFGWVGGDHNQHFLDLLIEPLNYMAMSVPICLHVISGKNYSASNAQFKIVNKKWSLETEKDDILEFDIGLMPLTDTLIEQGKCGFKLIQYMGLGVVSIATNIAINGIIINDGVNGFLVKKDNSNWFQVMHQALSVYQEFEKIGIQARKTITDEYSFAANQERFFKFIKQH